MNTVLLGNIVALIGAAIMVLIGFLKTKKQILTAQCFQYVALSVSNAILARLPASRPTLSASRAISSA